MRSEVAKEPRGGPFASLSSSLLARKGQARPAMRPNSGHSLEDLGWNDHGHDALGTVHPHVAFDEPEVVAAPEVPAPIRYQAAITANLSRPEELVEPECEAPAPVEEKLPPARAPRTVRRAKVSAKAAAMPLGKAAFTLRLNESRHRRLRFACALLNRSGQQIVVEALERFLDAVPGLDELAERAPAKRLKGQF